MQLDLCISHYTHISSEAYIRAQKSCVKIQAITPNKLKYIFFHSMNEVRAAQTVKWDRILTWVITSRNTNTAPSMIHL